MIAFSSAFGSSLLVTCSRKKDFCQLFCLLKNFLNTGFFVDTLKCTVSNNEFHAKGDFTTTKKD